MKRTQSHIESPLPFARSYWVVPGRLLGGFYPGDRDPAVAQGKLNALLDCGVTHILNLMESTEHDHAGRPFHGYKEAFLELARQRGTNASWMQYGIPDLSVPPQSQMVSTLNAIDAAIGSGGCVYVHCWGGRGRTGTVMGCWLARHGQADPLRHLRQLTEHERSHFPHVPETSNQQRFVQTWRIGQ